MDDWRDRLQYLQPVVKIERLKVELVDREREREPSPASSRPICVINTDSVRTTAPTKPAAADGTSASSSRPRSAKKLSPVLPLQQKPKQEPLDTLEDAYAPAKGLPPMNVEPVTYADAEPELDDNGAGTSARIGFGRGRGRGRRREGRGRGLGSFWRAHNDAKLREQYWISCRFCATVFPETKGIRKVITHEETEHAEQVESSIKSPFYKIFNLKSMKTDAFPKHPCREKLLAKYPVRPNWPAPEPVQVQPKTDGRRGRGRWRRRTYSLAELICPHCNKQFPYPSACQQHTRYCPERPLVEGEIRRKRGGWRIPTLAELVCKYCYKQFQYPSFCRTHQNFCKNRPLAEGEDPARRRRGRGKGRWGNHTLADLTCQHCSREFRFPSDCRNHANTCSFRSDRLPPLPQQNLQNQPEPSSSNDSNSYPGPVDQDVDVITGDSEEFSQSQLRPGENGPRTNTICPHCNKHYPQPAHYRVHIRWCRFRLTSGRMRAPRNAINICEFCSQTCVGCKGLMKHYSVCPMRKRKAKYKSRNAAPNPIVDAGEDGNQNLMREDRTCFDCQRVFKFPSELVLHRRKFCPYGPREESKGRSSRCPPNLTTTTCQYCQRNFKFPSALWSHLHVCSMAKAALTTGLIPNLPGPDLNVYRSLVPSSPVKSESPQPSPRTITTSPVKQGSSITFLTCELCSHVSLSRMGLMNHRQIVHKITTPPVGSNTTSDQMDGLIGNGNSAAEPGLSAPTPIEESEAPAPLKIYKCIECFRRFTCREKLQRHERIHARGQPYKCKMCPAGFSYAAGLYAHMKKHNVDQSTEGGYQCRHCSFVLKNLAGRTLHESRVHGVVQDTEIERERQLERERRTNEAVAVALGSNSNSSNANSMPVPVPYPHLADRICRFCNLRFMRIAGKTVHERCAHKAEFEAAALAERQQQGGMQMVQSQSQNSASTSDIVIVSQEQEFFMENGDGEYDVDPLMMTDSDNQRGAPERPDIEEVQDPVALALAKALGPDDGDNDNEPNDGQLTLHYDNDNDDDNGPNFNQNFRSMDQNQNAFSIPKQTRDFHDPFVSGTAAPPEEIDISQGNDQDQDHGGGDLYNEFESILSTIGVDPEPGPDQNINSVTFGDSEPFV